ncbi:hypothetical protein PTKIN_Ptkin09bG0038400 [Pterospermum kingtungense]
MAPSFLETMAQNFVTKFFQQFVSTGCVILLEEDGTVFTFKGSMEKCSLEVVLNVHNPQFYWKIMTEADLGLADAFIHGDFTVQDKEHESSLIYLPIFIANRQSNSSASGLNKKRGWWAPELSTASIASAKYFLKHVLRQNTLSQARRNISHHYDLSNELFALFLGETMQYSCAIFKTEDEDLNVAQQRKISSLIDKTRIEKWHEVLDIGCGWLRMGFSSFRVVVICPQYTSTPPEIFEENTRSVGFLREYIFPGGCLPPLNRVLSTMAAASRLSVEHVENIGSNYFQTLRCWRKNLLENQSKILALGFDEKFIRTWEYYFHYCASGAKSRMLENYQVVFARPGNFGALGEPYQGFPSAYSY